MTARPFQLLAEAPIPPVLHLDPAASISGTVEHVEDGVGDGDLPALCGASWPDAGSTSTERLFNR
jgi:hypothetical protein